jgi:hypothetical protein
MSPPFTDATTTSHQTPGWQDHVSEMDKKTAPHAMAEQQPMKELHRIEDTSPPFLHVLQSPQPWHSPPQFVPRSRAIIDIKRSFAPHSFEAAQTNVRTHTIISPLIHKCTDVSPIQLDLRRRIPKPARPRLRIDTREIDDLTQEETRIDTNVYL